MNWDDLKFFLAVCRSGSIRGAARELGVNHATVSRRINGFESSLNERLFLRDANGYKMTKAAEEIYQHAASLEDTLNQVERKVVGRDQSMVGDVRITAADVIAQHLLFDDLAALSSQYPALEFEVIDSARTFNLTAREADIAIRICNQPPEHLIGKKVANVHRACYATREYIDIHKNRHLDMNWIGWSDKMRRPKGKIAQDYPRFGSNHKVVSAVLQMEACLRGMGVSVLPCFLGDANPDLERISPYTSEHKFDLWVLSHPDMRENKKIRTVFRFITERLEAKRGLIQGELYVG
jgi:DNA-binding transcriptional LysR family regulator